jgi:hypothetical protein
VPREKGGGQGKNETRFLALAVGLGLHAAGGDRFLLILALSVLIQKKKKERKKNGGRRGKVSRETRCADASRFSLWLSLSGFSRGLVCTA